MASLRTHFITGCGKEKQVRNHTTHSFKKSRAPARALPNMHVKILRGETGSAGAMWLLEKLHWKVYGQRQRIEHVSMDPDEDLSPEQVQQEIDKLERKETISDRSEGERLT